MTPASDFKRDVLNFRDEENRGLNPFRYATAVGCGYRVGQLWHLVGIEQPQHSDLVILLRFWPATRRTTAQASQYPSLRCGPA